MKLPLSTILFLTIAFFCCPVTAQTRRSPAARPRPTAARSAEIGQTAIVIDETLSILRVNPSLFSESVQRMHRGRKVQILGVAEADGVKFYKVAAPPSNFGWV